MSEALLFFLDGFQTAEQLSVTENFDCGNVSSNFRMNMTEGRRRVPLVPRFLSCCFSSHIALRSNLSSRNYYLVLLQTISLLAPIQLRESSLSVTPLSFKQRLPCSILLIPSLKHRWSFPIPSLSSSLMSLFRALRWTRHGYIVLGIRYQTLAARRRDRTKRQRFIWC